MKKYNYTIITFALIISLASCDFMAEEKPAKQTTSLFVLYDVSKTYRIKLKESHLREIFDKIAFSGGGRVYFANVLSNSSKQDVHNFIIPFFDSEINGGTDEQVRNQNSLLSGAYDELATGREYFIRQVTRNVLRPHTHSFSDVKRGVELAKMSLATGNTKARKIFLMISDGIHDSRPYDGENRIKEPIEFHDTKIIQVRGRRDYYLEAKSIINTVSVNDAISNF